MNPSHSSNLKTRGDDELYQSSLFRRMVRHVLPVAVLKGRSVCGGGSAIGGGVWCASGCDSSSFTSATMKEHSAAI